MIHGIVCSYLGDGEVDIGKTARWLEGFVDTIFFYDYQGDPARKYAVDYAKTFPKAKFAYHAGSEPNIFDDHAGFRSAAFATADRAWAFAPTDWVIFVDASESISTNLSYDHLEAPDPDSMILRYLYDEAAAASGNVISFPWYVFLQQGTVEEKQMPPDPVLAAQLETALAVETDPAKIADLHALQAANEGVIYWTCEPYVMAEPATNRLDRMFKVSTARTMDATAWRGVDDPAAMVGGASTICGIVSYGYARYSETDYHDPSLWIEANDVGFANRLLMQQFHDVGLPEVYATADPVGERVAPIASGAYLTPTVGVATTPDPGVLPTQCTWVFKVRGPVATGVGTQTIAAQWVGSGNQRAWILRRVSSASRGDLTTSISPDGTTVGNTNAPTPTAGLAPTGADEYLAYSRDQVAKQIRGWRSIDNGATWTATSAWWPYPTMTAIFDSNAALKIGALDTTNGEPWDSRIYSVELRTGLDPAAGTVLWRFDVNDYPGTGTVFTDPRGRAWTLSNATAVGSSEQGPVGFAVTPAYCYYIDQFTPNGATDPTTFQQWMSLWRLNPRDGVWYVNYDIGPIPLSPITGEPSVQPDEWATQNPATTRP